jgi:hypothetical protein
MSAAERAVGRLQRDLVFADAPELVFAGLHEFVVDVIGRCDEIGDAITTLYAPA